jgi:hypothetical protein
VREYVFRNGQMMMIRYEKSPREREGIESERDREGDRENNRQYLIMNDVPQTTEYINEFAFP